MSEQTSTTVAHQTVIPYLIVNDATAFIQFLQEVFGAKETYKVMRDEQLVRHAEVEIGGSTIMLADSTPDIKPSTAGLFITVDHADDTFQKALQKGATVINAMADQLYGRSGGIGDPFGNTWWITSPK